MQPIIALHTVNGGEELESHLIGGEYMNSFDKSPHDLFLAPTTITGWVNVYKGNILGGMFDTEEIAKDSIIDHMAESYVGTLLIEIEI